MGRPIGLDNGIVLNPPTTLPVVVAGRPPPLGI